MALSVLHSFLVWFSLCLLSRSSPSQLNLALDHSSPNAITFESTWHSLGPFRIGTREAVWGVDPLGVFGGFVNIDYNQSFQVRTPLVPNATTTWVRNELNVWDDDNGTTASFDIGYDHVDWAYQQDSYGWPALQFQTWIRGMLQNPTDRPQKVWIYPRLILEFYVNGQHFFGGDFFNFNRAPVLVELQPGSNAVNVRLVRDVRSMGAFEPPMMHAQMRVIPAAERPEIDYEIVYTVPDVVDNKIPSRYFSLPIRNPLGDWIVISDCDGSSFTILNASTITPIKIAPGQVRPIGLEIGESWKVGEQLEGDLCFSVEKNGKLLQRMQTSFSIPLKRRHISDASKFTFLHPSGAVSYAILKPPSSHHPDTTIPLLVGLHGAGVEADSDEQKSTFADLPDLEAFVLFPTGMSPWSGDDWHLWGSDDVLNAIDSVQCWISTMNWSGTRVDTDRIVVSGHSNGGQGTWYFATHFPDRVFAAVESSGYSSIENYVPYTMWREAEPLQNSVIHNARGSFRHELLLRNSAHMYILQQQGSADGEVPPYQGRLMSALRSELSVSSDYIELAGKPHWWKGAMTTTPLRDFYRQTLRDVEITPLPRIDFSIVIPGCGIVGTKFGVAVDQLRSPDRFGHIDVALSKRHGEVHWHMVTKNIHRLHFDFKNKHTVRPASITINSDPGTIFITNMTAQYSYTIGSDGRWSSSKQEWRTLDQRYGRQIGALDAILRTRGTMHIVSCVDNTDLAVQISRNLLQYYGADTNILPCEQYNRTSDAPGNVILLTTESEVCQSHLASFPIKIVEGNVHLRTTSSGYDLMALDPAGTGAYFIRPLPGERLELVIWGSNYQFLSHAARLAPSITGAGQPDFVVLGSNADLEGHGAALAMGFLDHNWNISRASFLP